MPRPHLLGCLLVALAILASACATVGSPSGGPVDQTPPTLVATSPVNGATNVAERTLRLAFSERIAQGTAARAVRVVPAGASPPRVRVRGDEIEIRFDSLRDATTYVVTVGTELADERNVRLTSPITVAFATGDQIDRGEITGTVRDPRTGDPAGGLSVLAYTSASPDLGTPADYRTEVGADGRFRLAYLRPDAFTVFALEDRNRNGLADPGERFAVPPQRTVQAVASDDSTAQVPDLELWVTALDTIPPQPRRVRPISDRRFAVRFDEPVQLLTLDADAWMLADSASASQVPVTIYQDPVQPAEIRFQTSRSLPATPHRLHLVADDAVADSSGTPVAPFVLSFTPAERADTTQARFIGFLPEASVAPDSALALRADQEGVGLRFTVPPDTSDLAGRIELTSPEGTLAPIELARTVEGRGLMVSSTEPLPSAFTLRLRQPDSTYVRQYVRLGPSDTGGLVGDVPNTAGRPVRIEVTLEDGTILSVAVDSTDRFEINGLAPGRVRLRLYEDSDGNGRWTGGRLAPGFAPPEPLTIVPESFQIRARWDTEVDAAFLALFPDTP